MNIKTLFIVVLWLFAHLAQAQQAQLVGSVFADNDFNCLSNSGDHSLSAVIQARDSASGLLYSAHTDRFGNYSLTLPLGSYTVYARLAYDNPYYTFCNNPVIRRLSFPSQVDSFGFAAQPTVFCPLLFVDMSSDGLPLCGPVKYYLNYVNLGTLAAANSSIEIDLPANMALDTISVPFTSLGNNRYSLSLGAVGIGQDSAGVVEVRATISCVNAVPGQSYCAKAKIFPNNLCGNLWAGPVLEGKMSCRNDSVIFVYQNRGINPILGPVVVSVVEDDLMYSQPMPGLGAGQIDSIVLPARTSKSYRMEIRQDSTMPKIVAGPLAWGAAEGCKPDTTAGFNTGFLTQYYSDNTTPFEAYDCQTSQSNLTYNNLRNATKGYGSNQYINTYTPLEYQIRFQNLTGTLVQNLEIIDTLPPYVDMSSLIVGASSHSQYQLSMLGSNILRIRYTGMFLPTVAMNAEMSHGFINLHFDQMSNNPLGTVIENRVKFIFNYTDTVISNAVYQTVGENFIQVTSNKVVYEPKASVTVYPNPMLSEANFVVEGIEVEGLQLQLFDVSGRQIRNIQSDGNSLQIHRNDLQPGVYFYRLSAKDGQLLDAGKLLLK